MNVTRSSGVNLAAHKKVMFKAVLVDAADHAAAVTRRIKLKG